MTLSSVKYVIHFNKLYCRPLILTGPGPDRNVRPFSAGVLAIE
jgi:hypothetical protein